MIKSLRKVLSWLSDGKWEIIHETMGPDSALVILSSLKSKGIRCRMRRIGNALDMNFSYRIQVIEDDVARARAVLAETLR